MTINWTKDKLLSKTDDELWVVYENAHARDTADYLAVRALIEETLIERANLSVGETGLKLDSPFGKLLAKYIAGDEAKAAAIAATERGEPALAGVEPILVERLGTAYVKWRDATVQAGTILCRVMNKWGYEQSQVKGPMPAGSIAKTSEIYRRKVAKSS